MEHKQHELYFADAVVAVAKTKTLKLKVKVTLSRMCWDDNYDDVGVIGPCVDIGNNFNGTEFTRYVSTVLVG